jgi:hypothetical protein
MAMALQSTSVSGLHLTPKVFILSSKVIAYYCTASVVGREG